MRFNRIGSIDRQRLAKRLGLTSARTMKPVDKAIRIRIDLIRFEQDYGRNLLASDERTSSIF